MKKIILIAALLVISSTVSANKPSHQRPFDKLDSDQSGYLSLVEFLAWVPEDNVDNMVTLFINRDKDQSGYLSKFEYIVKTNSAKR
jgi:hypothetical protein